MIGSSLGVGGMPQGRQGRVDINGIQNLQEAAQLPVGESVGRVTGGVQQAVVFDPLDVAFDTFDPKRHNASR